jgi:hypothetical protein
MVRPAAPRTRNGARSTPRPVRRIVAERRYFGVLAEVSPLLLTVSPLEVTG